MLPPIVQRLMIANAGGPNHAASAPNHCGGSRPSGASIGASAAFAQDAEKKKAPKKPAAQKAKQPKKQLTAAEKEAKAKFEFMLAMQAHVEDGRQARSFEVQDNQRRWMKELHLITAKPVLYIANVSEEGLENNPYLDAVNEYASKEAAQVVSVCAAIEADIAELDVEEAAEFLQEMGLTEPGLDRVIHAGYSLLSLQTYFTAGPQEVRAWTIRQGDTAPRAAGVIHTDFEKGFIRAEVVGFDDFIAGCCSRWANRNSYR